jgi:hypothetical protein
MGRRLLDRSKFGANLNPFEINLIRFKTESGGTVLPTPLVSAAPFRSPTFTPAPSHCHRAPASSRPTCQPPGPRHSRRRLPCLQRACRARATCAARRCRSGTEPLCPCHAGSWRRTPTPPSPLQSCPTRHRADPPLFPSPLCARARSKAPAAVSLSSPLLHPRLSTSPPPSSTLDSVCRPRTPGSPRPTTHF